MAHGKSRFKKQQQGMMPGQRPQQARINVPLNQLTDLVCSNCEAALFTQVFAMKHLPAMYSPQGREGTVNTPAGVMCVVCGAINNVKKKGTEEKKEDKLEQASPEFEKEFLNDTEDRGEKE